MAELPIPDVRGESQTPAFDDERPTPAPPAAPPRPEWCFLCQASTFQNSTEQVSRLLNMVLAHSGVSGNINPEDLAMAVTKFYECNVVPELRRTGLYAVVPAWTQERAHRHLLGLCGPEPNFMVNGLLAAAQAQLGVLLGTMRVVKTPVVATEAADDAVANATNMNDSTRQLEALTKITEKLFNMQSKTVKAASARRAALEAALAPANARVRRDGGVGDRAVSAAKRVAGPGGSSAPGTPNPPESISSGSQN